MTKNDETKKVNISIVIIVLHTSIIQKITKKMMNN